VTRDDPEAHHGPSAPAPAVRDERFADERAAAASPWYAVARAKSALLEPVQRAQRRATVVAPADLVKRYPVAVAAGSFFLGVLVWRSRWTRNTLRLAALWGVKSLLTQKMNRWF
jgi:hypothetical protein